MTNKLIRDFMRIEKSFNNILFISYVEQNDYLEMVCDDIIESPNEILEELYTKANEYVIAHDKDGNVEIEDKFIHDDIECEDD